MLCLFLLASFFPDNRIWGFNWWGYYPLWVPVGLFIIGLLAPVGAHLTLRNYFQEDSDIPDRTYSLAVIAITVVFGLLFWLLKAETHFLGDGYQQLSLLASPNVFVKPTNYGGTILHLWLIRLFGDHSGASVLLAYQIVAICAGVGFLAVTALSARALFERNVNRLLFLLGLASGGYMLLFFGYVENYAMFVLTVAVFTLVGLVIALRKVDRLWILPVFVLAVFFHVLGVVLAPAAVYLLVANTKLGAWLSALPRKLRWSMVVLAIVAAVTTFYYYYTTDYFFRFSLVPVIEDRFTVEGYTLFSLKHLVDFANLVILLLPGLPVVGVLLFFLPVREFVRRQEYRFILILLVSVLGAVFLFDPKLGMARDWDLFSFAGVPLAVAGYYAVLANLDRTGWRSPVCILAISLGLSLLFPRVVSQVIPDVSILHLRGYLNLDRTKTRNGRYVLFKYYRKLGEIAKADAEHETLCHDFPADRMLDSGIVLANNHQYGQALDIFEQVTEIDPINTNAWTNLGVCFNAVGHYDSALCALRISDGLNPYSSVTYSSMGYAYYHKKDFWNAEKYWLKAIKADTLLLDPLFALSDLYKFLGRQEEYVENFLRIASRKDAPLKYIQGAAELHLQEGEYRLAAETFRRALKKGLDSAYVQGLAKKHTELGRVLQLEE